MFHGVASPSMCSQTFGWKAIMIMSRVLLSTLQVYFFSLVAIWPPTAQVWLPVKNFSR